MSMCSIVNIYYDDYEADLYGRLWHFLKTSVVIIICKLRFGAKERFNVLAGNLYIIIANEPTKNYFRQQEKPTFQYKQNFNKKFLKNIW